MNATKHLSEGEINYHQTLESQYFNEITPRQASCNCCRCCCSRGNAADNRLLRHVPDSRRAYSDTLYQTHQRSLLRLSSFPIWVQGQPHIGQNSYLDQPARRDRSTRKTLSFRLLGSTRRRWLTIRTKQSTSAYVHKTLLLYVISPSWSSLYINV